MKLYKMKKMRRLCSAIQTSYATRQLLIVHKNRTNVMASGEFQIRAP